MDKNNMEFNNILLDNIETPINITFSSPSQIVLNSTEKHSSKNDEHDDSHFLREEIRQKNLLITSLISLRSTREPVDPQCELNNARKTTDDEKPDTQKSTRLLINCEKVNETPDNKDHENNVCINSPPSIENRISNLPDITDNKTSRNTNKIKLIEIPVQKRQIRERTVSQKNLRSWLS